MVYMCLHWNTEQGEKMYDWYCPLMLNEAFPDYHREFDLCSLESGEHRDWCLILNSKSPKGRGQLEPSMTESKERTPHLQILERKHARVPEVQMDAAKDNQVRTFHWKHPTQQHCPPGSRLSQQKEIIQCELLEQGWGRIKRGQQESASPMSGNVVMSEVSNRQSSNPQKPSFWKVVSVWIFAVLWGFPQASTNLV